MYQGSTPTIPIKFKNIDLSNARIYLTIQDARNDETLTLVSGVDFNVIFDDTDTIGDIYLTQEQTLNMNPGTCTVQAKWVFPDETTGVSKKSSLLVKDVINKDVISYGE